MNARSRLLACAVAELERAGMEQFSLRSVAVAAGVTPMAVYRHFKGRDELLAAVGEQAFESWERRIDAINETDPVAWLRRSGRAYAEFHLEEPARFDACFVLRTRVERLYPEDFVANRSPVISLIASRIREAQEQARLDPGDAIERAMFIWAQIHGLVMLHRSKRFAMDDTPFLDLCDRALTHFFDDAHP
ncbi:MAG: TetR/AcrR family transcriptional regulator [Lysobacter sp.]